MSHNKIVGAIELGTSKVAVTIGEIQKNKVLNVIGFAEIPSHGIKKGLIVDFKTTSSQVHQAISAAESNASAQIEYTYLAQTGPQIKCTFNTGIVTVSTSNNIVSQVDIQKVIESAKCKELPKDRVYMHHIQNSFKLDGRIVKNPTQMKGSQLSVDYWSVNTDANKLRDQIHIVNSFGLKVEDIILSSIASGSILAHESEKQNGVLIIDIGAGTTDYLLYKEGHIVHTGILPVGGDHITNDLSLGLRIDIHQAEHIKKEFGNAVIETQTAEEYILIKNHITQQEQPVAKRIIYQIIHARVVELFTIIKQNLSISLNSQSIPGGVLLTGGSAYLSGIEIVAGNILGLSVRQALPPSWVSAKLQNAAYSTVLGVLHYAYSGQLLEAPVKMKPHWMHRFGKLFTRNSESLS